MRKPVLPMLRFEKNLRLILDATKLGRIPVNHSTLPMSDADIRLLEAKGLITITADWSGRHLVSPSPSGIAYFSDKSFRLRKWFTDNLVALLALIIAVISFIRTF